MRFLNFKQDNTRGLAARDENSGEWRGLTENDTTALPALEICLAGGREALEDLHGVLLKRGRVLDESAITFLPPLTTPGKIICVGLNYAEHAREAKVEAPDYPTLFTRYATTLVGHGQPLIRPRVSTKLDYEGELVAVMGTGGRHIARDRALEHIAGWSIFNDASVRDYQFKTPQWTAGKNFDDTGGFGPVLVSADELPSGAAGLRLETRVNGETVQSASTDDMIFDVATLIAIISGVMTLLPGDIIVTGTPSGVGFARKPPLWLKAGDNVEVEIEDLGILRNPVEDETD